MPAACVQRKYNLGHSSASTKVWQSYLNSVQQSATRISHALESIVDDRRSTGANDQPTGFEATWCNHGAS